MLRKISFLFRTEGVASRTQYLAWGAALFLIKYTLDLLAVGLVFHRIWFPWEYLDIRLRELDWNTPSTVRFYCLMLALALPFIWAGTVLTLKRLRSANLPVILVWLFFIPYLNLLFFLSLLIAPETQLTPQPPLHSDFSKRIWKTVFIITVVCLGLFIISTEVFHAYGWGLFIGIPFFIGFVPGLLNGPKAGFWQSFQLALLAHAVLAGCLLLFAYEGLVCLAMAAPLTLITSTFGVLIGRSLRLRSTTLDEPVLFCLGALLLPLMVAEKFLETKAPAYQVTSTIEIQASPETVWQEVVAFSEIPPPEEWVFRSGIAYPIRAKIEGTGVGATRHCIFSTGEFTEPIKKWQEPELLQFTVASNPPPIREMSFYSIDPPHLHNFFISHAGQFKLVRTPTGTTRLEGTTWYSHNLYPAAYWRLWSDYIIHKIHMRVLGHIKEEVENQNPRILQRKWE